MSQPSRAASRPRGGCEEQIAFDVNDFPGGARGAIEAVLMVVDEPVTEMALASALELPVDDVRGHLEELEAEYAAQQRGFTLRSVAGGWRIYSRSDYAPVVEKFLLDGQQAKLTQASLETLAVIAYRQPISRSRVSRGPWRQRRRRGPHPAQPRAHRGARRRRRGRRVPLRHHRLLPPAPGPRQPRRPPALAPYLPEVDVLDEIAEQGRG